jgi:hypothetical protein
MSEEYENRRGRRDEPLHTEKIVTDRKIFFLDLKENDRGRFVKITEDVRGRRDTIMVPEEVLDDFIDALHDIADVNDGKEIDRGDGDAPADAAPAADSDAGDAAADESSEAGSDDDAPAEGGEEE